jgi:hypothetical protein
MASLRSFIAEHRQVRLQNAVAHGESTRIGLDERHREFAAAIDVAAAQASYLYAAASGVWHEAARQYSGSCAQMQVLVHKILTLEGHNIGKLEYFGSGFSHYFLRGEHMGEYFIIDPTWQQFFSEVSEETDYSRLPRTLIVPEADAGRVSELYGVPDEWSDVWANGRPDNADWHNFYDRNLDEIFADQGWD